MVLVVLGILISLSMDVAWHYWIHWSTATGSVKEERAHHPDTRGLTSSWNRSMDLNLSE